MVLFADFTLDYLAGNIHCHSADLILDLIHCFSLFLSNIFFRFGFDGRSLRRSRRKPALSFAWNPSRPPPNRRTRGNWTT